MGRSRQHAGTALVVVGAFFLSGCVTAIEEYHAFEPDAQYVNPGVFPGIYASQEGGGSFVLKPGTLRQSNATVVHLKSERPAYPGLPEQVSSEGYVQISLAYWLPINVTEKVPIIVDAGPYFESGRHCVPDNNNCQALENNTVDYASQTTVASLQNFLPLGYAVAQIAIRGTGTSGGCMELMGPNEVADLSQAITWLAEQPWSNGNVAMQGVSYDGSTPWMVAATGNPHLKTIVPISGLPDIFDLMFHNGSVESRGAVMHDFVYWPYGFSPSFWRVDTPAGPVFVNPPNTRPGIANGREAYQDRQNLICPEAYEGAVMGRYAATTGGRGDPASTYWRERDFRDDVLQNYKGSVFLIHGLQDWNVDPHAAIPFNAQLRAAGIKMKELYGQWDHANADSRCEGRAPRWAWSACRYDYSEILYRWFEHELKGNTTLPTGPSVQVQDNRGYWRNAGSFPPVDAAWNALHLVEKSLVEKPGTPKEVVLLPPQQASRGPAHYLEFKTEPFTTDVHVSGLPQLHVEFEAMGAGGYLGAWLFDENMTGHVLERKGFTLPYAKETLASSAGMPQVIGHAQMDLRYHSGGDQFSELVPGQRYVARMEFEPLDVFIPAGHRLTLWLFQYHYTYDHVASAVPSPVRVILGGPATVLRLPEVEVDPTDVFPVPGSHFPAREFFEKFHIGKPKFSTLVPPPPVGATTGEACLGVPGLRCQAS